MKRAIFCVLVLCVFCISCNPSSEFNVRTRIIDDKTWFECYRWKHAFNNEDLAICEDVKECIQICDKHRAEWKAENK